MKLKKYFYQLVFIISFLSFDRLYSQVEYQIALENPDLETISYQGKSILIDSNDNYNILSLNYDTETEESFFSLIKIYQSIDSIWSKTFHGLNVNIKLTDSAILTNGDIVLTGIDDVDIDSDISILVVKIDNLGEIIWAYKYKQKNVFYSISYPSITISNDEITISANYKFYSTTSVLLFKLYNNGTIKWSKLFRTEDQVGSSTQYYPSEDHILITNDGGSLFTGRTRGNNTIPETNGIILKTDSLGNLEWGLEVGGINEDALKQAIQTNNGNFIIIGNTSSYGQGSSDIFILKVSSIGNILWAKTIGDSDSQLAKSCITDNESNLWILGNNFVSATSKGMLLKIDSLGTIESIINNNFNSFFLDFNIDSNNDLIITGRQKNLSQTNNFSLIGISKLNIAEASLCTSTPLNYIEEEQEIFYNDLFISEPIILSKEEFEIEEFETDFIYEYLCDNITETEISESNDYISVFPNPAYDEVNFKLESKSLKNYSLSIYNIHGQLILNKTYNSSNIIKFNIHQYNKGVYIYKLFEENKPLMNGMFISI